MTRVGQTISSMLAAELTWRRVVHTDKLTWVSRALSLTGLAIAAYLTTVYLKHVPPLCGTSGGCVTVQHSRYAHPAGVPLPLLGLLGYAMLFVTACLPGQRARTVGMIFTVARFSTTPRRPAGSAAEIRVRGGLRSRGSRDPRSRGRGSA